MMKRTDLRGISTGEIWAVGGSDAVVRGAWCWKVAHDEELTVPVALLSFAQHEQEARRAGGWPAARYYGDGGKTVSEFLSYEDVYDINPFEIGAKRPETRKSFAARLVRILRLLTLVNLKDRPVIALSNGEMRRVLFARALAKGPKILVLDDPAAGLDVKQRGKLKGILSALAAHGISVVISYRHLDELPQGITRWLAVNAQGVAEETVRPMGRTPRPSARLMRKAVRLNAKKASHACGKPVLEIRDLCLAYGARKLFSHFSWTVFEGERWVLRGENGSGKTTLFALVTGDSPLAYAADVRVFGIARETGSELAKVRRRIGIVSPEMQAYLGESPFALLDSALRRKPSLLLLDEPFMNMDEDEAHRAAVRIAVYLEENPKVTAIMVCHRRDEAPSCFDRELDISA